MRDQDKNRDPVKAKRRARSDFRCAARKLGPEEARAALAELFPEPVLTVEELRDEGMVAVISTADYWICAGVRPCDQGSAQACGDWRSFEDVWSYGDAETSGLPTDPEEQAKILDSLARPALELWQSTL